MPIFAQSVLAAEHSKPCDEQSEASRKDEGDGPNAIDVEPGLTQNGQTHFRVDDPCDYAGDQQIGEGVNGHCQESGPAAR